MARMRWTRDTMGDALKMYQLARGAISDYENRQAGLDYERAQEQLETPEFSGEERLRRAEEAREAALRDAEARAAAQTGQQYAGLADPSPVEGQGLLPSQTREQFRGQVQREYEPTMAAVRADRERPAGDRYSIGSGRSFRQREGTPFTRNERRTTGLQAMADRYYGYGRMEEGSKAEGQATQLRRGELELAGAERKELIQKAQDAVREKWKNPVKAIETEFNLNYGPYGQGALRDTTMRLMQNEDGSFTGRFFDKEGNVIQDIPMSRETIQRLATRSALVDAALADPSNTEVLAKLEKLGIDREELEAKRALWKDQGVLMGQQGGYYGERTIASQDVRKNFDAFRTAITRLDRQRRENPMTEEQYWNEHNKIVAQYFPEQSRGLTGVGGRAGNKSILDVVPVEKIHAMYLKARERYEGQINPETNKRFSEAEVHQLALRDADRELEGILATVESVGGRVKGFGGFGGNGREPQNGGDAALARAAEAERKRREGLGKGKSGLQQSPSDSTARRYGQARLYELSKLKNATNQDLESIVRSQPGTPTADAAAELLEERANPERRMGIGQIFPFMDDLYAGRRGLTESILGPGLGY